MANLLKLYKYIDGVNDTPFPNEDEQVVLSSYRYDVKRMGGAPTISCTVMHPLCLDKEWDDTVYTLFNGEKYFIKQTPSSSYDNTNVMYKHELELVSERIVLDNVYFYDVVTDDTMYDKPVSNSSKFTFYGDVNEFAKRLNYSLLYSGVGYRVVVDSGISSQSTLVSFQDQFLSVALQEIYNAYEIPYYFDGKVIHIGYTSNAITKVFKYGKQESLLSIQKQNANYKIVNRVTGVGSSDNIPYYYPNDYESKEEVESNGGVWVNPQTNLMPPIYRETFGNERFYKALNNEYINPSTGEYYYFERPFVEGKPKEQIVNFDQIKPTIEGTTNARGQRIDMFSEFAYDNDDNDDVYPDGHEHAGEYKHPYFFGKLRRFDGEFGFNLFDHAIDEQEMVISMTSGSCGACEWVIGVLDDSRKNPVQVDENGNLKRDEAGNVMRSGTPQDRQNDTQNYEVWIALKKDINTFGTIMPNATNDYKPSVGDTFVILHIDLPKAYILAAEEELKEQLVAYMALNNSEKFNFTVSFSRIFFAENPSLLAQLNENARIQIEYDKLIYDLYISSYSYSVSSDNPLPEIKIELTDTLTISQNALQQAISEVKKDLLSSNSGFAQGDFLGQGLNYFLRKDIPDTTKHTLGVGGLLFQNKQISRFTRYYDEDKPEEPSDSEFWSALMTKKNIQSNIVDLDERYIRKDKEDTAHKHITFEEGITVYQLAKMLKLEVTELATIAEAVVNILRSSKFVDGFFGEGYQIWKSIATGDWCMTLDRLTVRKTMTVFELIIQKIRSVGGMIVVSAGNGKIKTVEQIGLEYRFTFEDENTFVVNDLIRCQVWTGTGIKYYWVEVTKVVGDAIYTRVSEYSGVIPSVGDEVVLMGNTKNPLRQGLVLISAAEDGQPRVDCLDGVHTKNFDGCLKARLGSLDGIRDSMFPADMQPKGYGLYGNNCYLTGVFVLSNGKDVQTQFAILEGMIHAELSSIRQEVNEGDNYLSNASFVSNLDLWEYSNDVRIFNTSGGLLHFNGDFYSNKVKFAGISAKEGKNVLRLKNSYILQKNENFRARPEFKLVEQFTTDENGNEITTGIKLYRPRMFYASFKYMVGKRGTLRVYFKDEEKLGTFEEYVPMNYTKVLDESGEFATMEINGKWNGTGDFYLSFDGDIYIYNLALADNKLADMEEIWNMQLEITDKKIQANAEHIIQQGKDIEAYRSEFLFTAEQLRTEFTTLIQNTEDDITEEYTGLVTQTSQKLESDYNAKFGNYYGTITEEYSSKITQEANRITTSLTAKIDNTDGRIDSVAAATKQEMTTLIMTEAGKVRTELTGQINDLKTGDIATMKTSIEANTKGISTKVSQTDFDALSGRVSKAETSINQTATQITLMATKGELADEVALINTVTDAIIVDVSANAVAASNAQKKANSAYDYASTNYTRIQEQADRISAVAGKIQTNSDGLITNISTSGLVLDSEFASLFSSQVTSQGIAKTAQLNAYVLEDELGDLVSKIEISADQIDLQGVVTYQMLNGTLQNTIDGKAEDSEVTALNNSIGSLNVTIRALQTEVDGKASTTSLNNKVNELNIALQNKADSDLTNAVIEGSTLIVGGYINTDVIDVDSLVVKKFQAYNSGYTYTLDANGFVIKDTDDAELSRLFVSNYQSLLSMKKGDLTMELTPASLEFSHDSSVLVTASGITFNEGSSIKGFAIGNFGGSTSNIPAYTDFVLMSRDLTLPTPSVSNKGKVIFVKFDGSHTLYGSIIKRHENSPKTSSSHDYAMSAFYISNGTYWYEFLSNLN